MPDEFTDPGKEIKERGRNICFLIQMPLTGVRDILTRFPECLRTRFQTAKCLHRLGKPLASRARRTTRCVFANVLDSALCIFRAGFYP